jgi:hypothetical protein
MMPLMPRLSMMTLRYLAGASYNDILRFTLHSSAPPSLILRVTWILLSKWPENQAEQPAEDWPR